MSLRGWLAPPIALKQWRRHGIPHDHHLTYYRSPHKVNTILENVRSKKKKKKKKAHTLYNIGLRTIVASLYIHLSYMSYFDGPGAICFHSPSAVHMPAFV
jgi:hypothetical protein